MRPVGPSTTPGGRTGITSGPAPGGPAARWPAARRCGRAIGCVAVAWHSAW